MKKTVDNTIVVNTKMCKTSNDLDFEMYNVLGTEKVNVAYEEDGVHVIYNGDPSESYPIEIKKLEKIIDKLKKEGCNFISIDYNCDHPSYTFFGVDVHPATNDEVSFENEKNKETEKKRLQDELLRIDKKREEISKNLSNF